MGTGYGAAVRWGCMQGCGIGGLHVGQLYMMDGCRAAVHRDWIWGCSTVGLHAGRHKVRRPAAQPHRRGIRREVPAWQCHAGQHTTPQALELTSRALLWMALHMSEGSGCLVLAFSAFSAFWHFSVQRKQTSDKESKQGEAGTGRSTNGNSHQTNRKQAHDKEEKTNKQTNKQRKGGTPT